MPTHLISVFRSGSPSIGVLLRLIMSRDMVVHGDDAITLCIWPVDKQPGSFDGCLDGLGQKQNCGSGILESDTSSTCAHTFCQTFL